jgi:hypothetical protein
MYSVRARIAQWVMRHRRASMLAFVIVTAVFALGIRNVEIKTIFSDLLPTDDPFVQVYKDHPNFGNPLTVTVMVQNRNGDIYNAGRWQGMAADPRHRLALRRSRPDPLDCYGRRATPKRPRTVWTCGRSWKTVPALAEKSGIPQLRNKSRVRARSDLGDSSATLINATFISAARYGEASSTQAP